MEEKLYAKFSKCEFWLDSVAFLGHVVSKENFQLDPLKIEAVKGWTRPTSSVSFEWSDECEESFQNLKDPVDSALVLTLPKEGLDFTVYYDASGVRLGGVLMQKGKVIAYTSR
ncbi:uncharacterized mitochondrial protein AtMg00860-like [Solanum tuberosum]|uniref:uncharacterized mitochondrial protein AtMg00860-like n=1 Tax=Solanum tuberosum TaxID=4113 RepID=UPI00073A3C7F|nr:PREDICTED: uncharacterized mitochondrial protein AtMg00860-like [Solanum tuberosum]